MSLSDPGTPLPHGLQVCVLASGSRGNAIFVSDGATSILVDAGLSGIEIERRLQHRGIAPENLAAILVSHEHTDHIQGVGVLSRRYRLPIYMSHRTGLAAPAQVGRLHARVEFRCGSTFKIKTLAVHPFTLSHDAEDPAGFTFHHNGLKVGIATDLGIATAMVKEHLKTCSVLILEANHDPDMLINGPYPWPLKQRIRGRSGHLSNPDCRALLAEVRHDALQHVVLAHLSEKNNTPHKALGEVGQALQPGRTRLHVARQDRCGELLHIR